MIRVRLLIFLVGLSSCTHLAVKEEKQVASQEPYQLEIPAGFPSMEIPPDNALSAAKIALGKRLFFDTRLSLDSSISCGSCHIPGSAFSDTVAFSQGILNKHAKRNSPSLMNIGFNPSFMAEGGVKSLELQVLAPIENDDEMGMTIGAVCDRLNTDEYYRKAFRLIWDTAATPYTVTRSIAAFERTLIGGNSKYDRFANGDSSTFTSDERNGFILFNTERFNCSSCHSGRLFTNNSIENNGLYVSYTDNGLFRLSLKQGDMGKFKVPTLRNIALTAPYMHDGSMRRLEDVIDHYDNGGANHANKSEFIKPIHMTDDERKSLIAFLKTLTEES